MLEYLQLNRTLSIIVIIVVVVIIIMNNVYIFS